MERREYIERTVRERLEATLARGRSVLLLGPRQTGKTTLLERLRPDLLLDFMRPEVRLRYERQPGLLGAEVEALTAKVGSQPPLIALDEVQRVPELVNVVQHLIDRRVGRFVLTGSSVRKLRRGRDTNWLPGRVVPLRLARFQWRSTGRRDFWTACFTDRCRALSPPVTTRAARKPCAPTHHPLLGGRSSGGGIGAEFGSILPLPATGGAGVGRQRAFSRVRAGVGRGVHNRGRLLRNSGRLPDRGTGRAAQCESNPGKTHQVATLPVL